MEPATASADATSPAAPTPVVPYEKPPERVAAWPTWFGPADAIMAAGLLVMVFLTASFTARNSDIWLHLAAGKRLASGEYKLGTDPFSYTAADRTWVNHSWLWDLGANALYSGEGGLLVVLKALAAVGAFALILGIRRAGQPLWPWVVLGTLALLSSATLLTLRPYIASVLFLAATLWLVFRLPSPAGSWTLPIAIGLTFALWSNLDYWFILGPFTLLLLLVGELVRTRLGGAVAPDPADTLAQLPDVPTLVKALVVGGLACMVNPHHVGVWELPFELAAPDAASLDPRVRVFLHSPLKTYSAYWASESLGLNAGGISYLILLAAGLYAAFLSAVVGRVIGRSAEVEPLPMPLMFLWIGFAALSLLTMFALPFFALVTVPLVASRFNMISERTKLGFASEGKTRWLLSASTTGRLATVLGVGLLCLIAWPGWLHAPASAWWESGQTHPANTRRVEWRIEADPEMKESAEWLAAARASGKLPDDVRGFAASMDFANYCAYFAPQEKVFANGRYGFHTPELADFAKARRGLGAFSDKAEPPDPRDADDVFNKWKTGYVVIAWQRSDTELNRFLLSLQERLMWLNLESWTPWHFNGRSAISGWRPAKSPVRADLARLEIDPVAIAYGPGVERVPPGHAEPPHVQVSSWDELFVARRPTPTGVEESSSWLTYKMRAERENLIRVQVGALLRLNQPGTAVPVIPQTMFLGLDESRARQQQFRVPPPPDGSFQTYSILAMRAARRAIAENPDHPDGYYALIQVLNDRDLPIGDGERAVSLACAYQQCLARLPKPADYRRNFQIASPTEVAYGYVTLLLGRKLSSTEYQGLRADMGTIGEFAGAGLLYSVPGPGNRSAIVRVPSMLLQQLPPGSKQLAPGSYLYPLDIAKQWLATALEYAKVEFPDPERRTESVNQITSELKALDTIYNKSLEGFRNAIENKPRIRDRHLIAMSQGLIGEALNLLTSNDLSKEFGPEEAMAMYFRVVAIQLAIGRLEDAAGALAELRDHVSEVVAKPGLNPSSVQFLKTSLSQLEFQKFVLEGDYASAGQELEAQEGAQIGVQSLLDSLAKDNVHPNNYKNYAAVAKSMEALGPAWPLLQFLGTPVYGPGEPIAVWSLYAASLAQLTHFELLARARQVLSNKLQRDAEFFYNRGYLSLLEGDIAAAKTRFQSASRKAPEGWSLKDVRHVNAENFLRMIEQAAKPK
jgi:hypothetical protein